MGGTASEQKQSDLQKAKGVPIIKSFKIKLMSAK